MRRHFAIIILPHRTTFSAGKTFRRRKCFGSKSDFRKRCSLKILSDKVSTQISHARGSTRGSAGFPLILAEKSHSNKTKTLYRNELKSCLETTKVSPGSYAGTLCLIIIIEKDSTALKSRFAKTVGNI